MYKLLFLILISIAATPSFSDDKTLDAVMKEMALSYKYARSAKDIEELHRHLDEITAALEISKQIGFKQKPEKSLEGINAVKMIIAEIKVTDDLESAKKALREVDVLRKKYHKIHEPSVWQLLFGN